MLVILATLVATAMAYSDAVEGSICKEVEKFLPSFCTARADCLKIGCEVDLLHKIQFGLGFNIHQCADPLNVVVYANTSSMSWAHEFTGSESVAIPGLSIDIDGLKAGVFATVELDGESGDEIDFKLGVAACISLDEQDEEALLAKGGLRGTEVQNLGDKCYPNPPLDIFDGRFSYSGAPCDDDDDLNPSDIEDYTNDDIFAN